MKKRDVNGGAGMEELQDAALERFCRELLDEGRHQDLRRGNGDLPYAVRGLAIFPETVYTGHEFYRGGQCP